jgi:hypothetical protein
MGLAATRVQFECNWPPVACFFCISYEILPVFFKHAAKTIIEFKNEDAI